MTDSLQTLLLQGKIKAPYLPVQVVKQIDSNSYIIADKSRAAVLDTSKSSQGKNLVSGASYKIIKGIKEDENTLQTNPSYKPVAHKFKLEISKLDEKVEELEEFLDMRSKKKLYTDIASLHTKLVHSKIQELTVKIMSKSRIITTAKGSYQICTIKDWKGEKTSLNLYTKFLDSVEVFKIYKFTNLRKGEINKNEEVEMRLHTTGFTKIEEGTVDDILNFKDVHNGDAVVVGEFIGVGDITWYRSCKSHFCKVTETNECMKCKRIIAANEIEDDFRMEIYIEEEGRELKEEEAEVKQILMFKRTIDEKYTKNIEEGIEKLIAKKMRINYNIEDGNRFIGVLLELLD